MLSTHVKVFLTCSVLVAALVFLPDLQVRLPGNDQHYEPEQPIAFSHRLHAGELEISCLYCHSGAEQSRTAGIPAASLCMSCHQHVTAASDVVEQERRLAQAEGREPTRIVSVELAKLYRALGLNDELERDPQAELEPIAWTRIHDLPDHVYFDHRVHVARGIECQACHGPVETMERVRQEARLSMGWCLECHRTNFAEGEGALPPGSGHPRVHPHASTDCSACHF